jgi:xylulokinase
MIRTLLLGVDLGTTASKAALYRLDGTCLAEGRAELPLHYPAPGAVEQDSHDFYLSAAAAVRQCLNAARIDAAQIAGIAFDSQMAGVGTVEDGFEPATRFDSWLDMRCGPYVAAIDRDHGERIAALTGCAPTCDHGPKMLWWQHERPADYARIAKFVMPAGYVAGRAAGLRAADAFIDHTFLHFTCLADARAGHWSPELIGRLGVDAGKLPRIVRPWDQIGEMRPEAAGDFGLVPGTPIAAGCGDTAAGALGAGIVKPGMVLDTAGTASVFACCTDTFVADTANRTLLTMRSVVDGLWNPLAYIGGGGLALRWFRDNFGLPGDELESVTQLASQAPPGSDGLLFSPHLGGRVCPAGSQMRGAWGGFSWSHGKAHFARSILESVAFEYAIYLDIIGELVPGFTLNEARVIGGGAASGIWNQIKSDVLRAPYRRVLRQESATWGAAMIAGKAAGLITDLAAHAAEHASVCAQVTVPSEDAAVVYERSRTAYRAWQKTLDRGMPFNA